MLRKLFTAALVAAATSFAPVHAAPPALEIGYLPILPDAQLFVALEEGTLQAKGAPAPQAGVVPERSGADPGAAGRATGRRLRRHRPGAGGQRQGRRHQGGGLQHRRAGQRGRAGRAGAVFRLGRSGHGVRPLCQGQGQETRHRQLPQGRRARGRAAILAAQPPEGGPRQPGPDLPGRGADPAIAADRRHRRRRHPRTHRHHRADPRPPNRAWWRAARNCSRTSPAPCCWCATS